MITDALTASELRYRRLFEAAQDGLLLLDPVTGRIIDVNPFLTKLLGRAREEILGQDLFQVGLYQDEAASQASTRELMTTGSIRHDNLRIKTEDGRWVDVELSGNLYQEGNRQVVECAVRDVTVRKKNESTARDADLMRSLHTAEMEQVASSRESELRISNLRLETTIATIARDLRAPLRSMQGFAQLLVQEHTANLNKQGRDYANYINTAAQMMDRLLTDLLDFSHISQQRIQLEPVALEPVVESALSGCETAIIESEATIDSNTPWPAVVAHATTLRRVLVNLIGNALKFVVGKEPKVRLRTEERPGGIVRIWVEDNGIGISPEFHERIFQVFQRLHTTSYTGTGIGLAIVQKGVERMGGSVGLVSAPGEGSRFWIELPKAPSAATAP